MNKNTLIAIAAVLLVAVGGYFYPGSVLKTVVQQVQNLGAEGDTNLTNLVLSGYLSLIGTSTVSGAILAPSLVAVDADGSLPSVTISTISPNAVFPTATNICSNPIFNVSAMSASTGTVQLPSSTAWASSCFSNPLGVFNFSIWNNATGSLTFGSGGSSTIGLFYTASTTNYVAQSSTLPSRAFADFVVHRYPSGTDGTWTSYGYVIRF